MKNTLIAIFLILFCVSCQDEFCLDSTTPNLIIRFRDINTDTIKPITLKVGVLEMDTIINNQTLDSIVLPIDTSKSTLTYYIYKVDELENKSLETITVNYQVEDQYVSKACGFKSIFKNISIAGSNNDWLLSAEKITSDITNENQAHVKILH